MGYASKRGGGPLAKYDNIKFHIYNIYMRKTLHRYRVKKIKTSVKGKEGFEHILNFLIKP